MSVSSSGRADMSPAAGGVAAYQYYAPLPLRVVNEDYAVVAGLVGGVVVFAAYFLVLTCLRCVQELPRKQRDDRQERQLDSQQGFAADMPPFSTSNPNNAAPTPALAPPATALRVSGQPAASQLYAAPHYARGILAPHHSAMDGQAARATTAAGAPPTPPPRVQ